MHILIAPNAFKNSLGAVEVAEAIQKGFEQSKLKCSFDSFPVGDGGDGTAELIIRKLNGTIRSARVHDPIGRQITATFGLIAEEKTAVIEMANASGLRLLKETELDPLHASTYGTGELVKNALENNVSKLILCIGGSATVDGGVGLLKAFGLRFLDAGGKELSNLPEDLVNLDYIDLSELDKRILQCEITVLCDVENTLLGKMVPQRFSVLKKVQSLKLYRSLNHP